jgi:hypothetical protein
MNSGKKKYICFYDEYEAEIAPLLRSIDVFLRTERAASITPAEAARLLGLSPDEVFSLFGDAPETIDRESFFYLLRSGSNKLCQMLNRELECGCPVIYKPHHVAYIYGLSSDAVARAFHEMSCKEITARVLPALFKRIS